MIGGVVVALAAIGAIYDGITGGTSTSEKPKQPISDTKPIEQTPPTTTDSVAAEAPPVPEPTAKQLAADETYFKTYEKNPGSDAYKRTARKHKMSREDVLEAVTVVGEYRAALLEEAKRSVSGIIGDLDIKTVTRTEFGTHTAIVSFTAIRCPEGNPGRDKKLELLATTALKKLASKLPESIDSYNASLWYRGMSCDRGSMGYGATWTRKGGIKLE